MKEVLGGEFVGKHNQVSSDLFTKGKIFLGSIRHPWEWYISLWAFGCDNQGGVFSRVTKSKGFNFREVGWKNNPYAAFQAFLFSFYRSPEKWKRIYRDVNDASAFREWLYMMHDQEYCHDIGEGYGTSSLSKIAGLLTYRYMKLFCCKYGEIAKMNAISKIETLMEYEKENCLIDYFICNNNLESTLFKALYFRESSFQITNKPKSCRCLGKYLFPKMGTNLLL
ncbi:MAG: hypothetical protein BRC54_03835 [Cyanobacteria bacterium SW_7_48_12]|nr:MAG: hypothetical protein BRC54_03835 [Cyanobacteria bacterium SW_7_48_12]